MIDSARDSLLAMSRRAVTCAETKEVNHATETGAPPVRRSDDVWPDAGRTGPGRRLGNALGRAAAAGGAVDHGTGRSGRRGRGRGRLWSRHRHERERLVDAPGSGHYVRTVHRLRRLDLLPGLLRLRRR